MPYYPLKNKMKTKEELINEIIELEKIVYDNTNKELIADMLKDWFDVDRKTIKIEYIQDWYSYYLDDLYNWLTDYNIKQLKERIKDTKSFIRELL
jgi:hypothetical protein